MKKTIISIFFLVFLSGSSSAIDKVKNRLEQDSSKGMVFIKGGCFDMGDTFEEGDSDEKPMHEVCLDDFYLEEHEVTQGKWKEIMGNNPSNFKNCGERTALRKVSPMVIYRNISGN